MAEKRETQYVVMKQRVGVRGKKAIGRPRPTEWYEARRDAREEANRLNLRSRLYRYYVEPMHKGRMHRKPAPPIVLPNP